MWQELIHEQLQLSINSQYILAEHAGHGIENDRPDIIIEAVQSVRIKRKQLKVASLLIYS